MLPEEKRASKRLSKSFFLPNAAKYEEQGHGLNGTRPEHKNLHCQEKHKPPSESRGRCELEKRPGASANRLRSTAPNSGQSHFHFWPSNQACGISVPHDSSQTQQQICSWSHSMKTTLRAPCEDDELEFVPDAEGPLSNSTVYPTTCPTALSDDCGRSGTEDRCDENLNTITQSIERSTSEHKRQSIRPQEDDEWLELIDDTAQRKVRSAAPSPEPILWQKTSR